MKLNKKINTLSIFDGMSCGQIALNKAGIKYNNYFASEIDKYAIQITQKNYPNTVQLGDINNWKQWDIDWSNIDLLLAGFPCQAWSVAGKQKGDDDPRGQLVHVLIEIWNHCKNNNPNLKFLFENVKMKKEFINYINNLFGVEAIHIDSSLLSAQSRKRIYWTNIPNIKFPEDKGILLKDIVHENNDELDKIDISEYIVPFNKSLQILEKEVERGKVGYFGKDSQANRIYYIHNKAVTLCGEAGGGAAKMGQYLFGCITPDRIEKRQNGQRFNNGEKSYTLTTQDKHGVIIDGYIRKLTEVECERLQTVNDNYTEGISKSQRYKILGNGWTVDIITHILQNIK